MTHYSSFSLNSSGLVEAMAESGGGREVIDKIARTFQAINRLSPEEVAAMLAQMKENS
ncbi:hypothetical protein LYNGBM3L_63390 [Moorena producens 3L]|uniref:Uncharacterized protein n=1 Tax=Moorena producens 3L TaxID=489825 RepID=F4Y145_9CYAN|nr:hypothetical protein [Moorena producens 3L]EGJ29556.1 hypothetical protein LYNGBM3L_63390 [Moorena producens 3L]NEP67196.1 hypothetical protein [Moorena sp. SIO3A5]